MPDFDMLGYDQWKTTPPDERETAPWGELRCDRGHVAYGRDRPHRTCWQCTTDDFIAQHQKKGAA